MIAPMKKLQILLPSVDRDRFLEGLAQVGVVHIEERFIEESSPDLEDLSTTLRQYQTVFNVLKPHAKNIPADAPAPFSDAKALVEEYRQIDHRRTHLQQVLSGLEKDIQLLTPWGDFDPALVKKMAEMGITLTFHEMPSKKFAQLPLAEMTARIINAGTTVRFVMIHYKNRETFDLETLTIPNKSLANLVEERSQVTAEIADCTRSITALAASVPMLSEEIAHLVAQRQLAEAQLHLESGAEGAVCLCSGWIPADDDKKIREYLDKSIVWYEIRKATPDETPPVKLANRPFASKFEPVTRMFALPDYHEIDPTPFFAPFFMFFYGMCLGDVGYGAIVFIAALVATLKASGKMRNIFILGMFLGAATILNGFFLNSFFGASLFNTPGMKGIAGSGGFLPFLGSRITDGKTVFPAMTFAIYIGVVQMLLGMLLQTVNRFRTRGALHAVQPFCYLPLTLSAIIALCKANFLDMGTYAINSIEIGRTIAALPNNVLFTLLGIGIVPFVFLNSPSKKIWLRPAIFLWEFYNFVNSVVAYGLSYLRLFALGLAGGLLGNAFNQIALMLITDHNGQITMSWLFIFTLLIMIGGHTLNFALSALGAYVHTVRLTFVEFYGALSFAGGGKPYIPLTGKNK